MYISHIQIKNFRNFSDLSLDLHQNVIIVGENKIGKSNLLFALRLVLDPKISDSERQLRLEDFWDGLPRPLSKDDFIQISVDFSGFEKDKSLMAVLAEHLVNPEPMVSRLTYLYRPKPTLTDAPKKESDYEFLIFGGGNIDNQVGYEIRKWLPLALLPALRNAEEDLQSWNRSPLAPLLRAAQANIDRVELEKATAEVTEATNKIATINEVKSLADQIQNSLKETVGEKHAITTSLGFSPANPDKILRSLRLLIDGGMRGVADASLGSANLLYLTLLMLDLDRQVAMGERSHTFLAIEEPEAHLHPHVQRLVFKDFLESRTSKTDKETDKLQTVLLTTHSPQIVSVTPVNSIIVLRKSEDGKSTVGASTANLKLDDKTLKDLERYLDAKRGEIVFAKGILLVEGPAEEYIIPRLGKLLGIDFDEYGISVCSINGANFAPYIQFLGKNGLDIPIAVLTDLDPGKDGKSLGIPRARALMSLLNKEIDFTRVPDKDIPAQAMEYGIFLNSKTFEIELFLAGISEKMRDAVVELSTNGAAQKRVVGYAAKPESLDQEQFLKDIEEIGKGRFAQRLASLLDNKVCPSYIEKAILYVRDHVR